MSKIPLLLVHGALGSKVQWERLEQKLSSSFEVFSMDLPGHGSMKFSGTFTIPAFSVAIEKFLAEKKIGQVDVLGYSMGGYTALYLTAQKPELVRHIFTLGTKFLWTSDYAVKETGKLDPDKILAKVPAFAADLEKRHGMVGWKDVLANTRALMLSLGNRNLLESSLLSLIEHPVRIGIGDRDITVSLKESQDVAQLLPNAQLEVFPNTPHPLDRVSLERLAFSVKEFFAD